MCVCACVCVCMCVCVCVCVATSLVHWGTSGSSSLALVRSVLLFSLSHAQKRKVRKMHIMKTDSGLGLRIIGGKGSKFGDMGIFVNKLEEGGAAFK